MIKFAVEQWDKNKDRLENHIIENLQSYEYCSYAELVEDVVKYILNDEEERHDLDNYSHKKITEIDDGSYQGTILYLIPLDMYQPDESEYLMTYVNYGSCSGYDALKSVQCDISDAIDEEDDFYTKEERDKIATRAVKDLMSLCLHLIQNTIKPYNTGWNADERFNTIKENSRGDHIDE